MKPISMRLAAIVLAFGLLLPILTGCSKPAENTGGQTAKELHNQKKGTSQ